MGSLWGQRLERIGTPKLDIELARVRSPDERRILFTAARGISSTARHNLALLSVLGDAHPSGTRLGDRLLAVPISTLWS